MAPKKKKTKKKKKKKKKKAQSQHGPLDCHRIVKVDGMYTLLHVSPDDVREDYWPQSPDDLPEALTVKKLKAKIKKLLDACDLPVLELEGLTWRYEDFGE